MAHDDDNFDLGSDDWGDSIDDADGASYESFGYEPQSDSYDPDDDYDYDPAENVTCPSASGGEHCGLCVPDSESESGVNREAQRKAERLRIIKNDSTTERRSEILKWLYHSNCSKNFKTNNGFFVNAGPVVKEKNGHTVDILKWLFTEGILHNTYISGYLVVDCEESENFPEKIMFFKVDKAECEKSEKYQNYIEKDGENSESFRENIGIELTKFYRKPNAIDRSTERQLEILEWLKESHYAKDFKNGKGFYVRSGRIVRTRSGEKLDIVLWLKKEGFILLSIIGDYGVKHSEESNDFPEAFHFFQFSTNHCS